MAAKVPTAVAGTQQIDSPISRLAMPPEVRAELRRLLKEMLVADYRAEHLDAQAAGPTEPTKAGCPRTPKRTELTRR